MKTLTKTGGEENDDLIQAQLREELAADADNYITNFVHEVSEMPKGNE